MVCSFLRVPLYSFLNLTHKFVLVTKAMGMLPARIPSLNPISPRGEPLQVPQQEEQVLLLVVEVLEGAPRYRIR